MKHSAERKNETPEEISAHINQLMAEAEAMLAGPVASKAGDRLDEMKARLAQAKEKLADYYGAARKKVIAGARATDETIRSHPYESLAIALGVGVLLGALVRRSSSD